MSRFKPGDPALVIDCILPELIGRVVELLQCVPPGERTEHSGRPWINKSDAVGWLVSGQGLLVLTELGRIEKSEVTLIAEHKLMPLRGSFRFERTNAREVA